MRFHPGVSIHWVSSLVILHLVSAPSLSGATFHVAIRDPRSADDGPGTAEQPWKAIAKAAAEVRPGDVVRVHGGVYRERVLVKANGTAEAPIRFVVPAGEHVVVTGADLLSGWQRVDGTRPVYRVPWPYRFIPWNANMTHPDDAYHRVIGRCEQVAVDGYLLRQVLGADQLAPGTFLADVTRQALLVWEAGGRDLHKLPVEASVRQEVIRVEGDHVQLDGFHFRLAANMAQHGAVVLAGRFDVMEDCTVEAMNAAGATFQGEDAAVRRCVFRDNGQLGFGAGRAHRLLFTDCVVENNNTKGFDRGWEAGGDKLVLCRDVVLERSRFVRNRGNGIWFDIGNTNCTVRQCLIAGNEDAGIFYEISFNLHAHDNVLIGNGFAETAGAWGAQAGICLSSSPGCVVERNVLAGNREGFNFREQTRTTPTLDDRSSHPVWNHDEIIRDNLILYNRDAQVWGWFDVKDGRHWPADGAASRTPPPSATNSPGEPAGADGARRVGHPPDGLTLHALNLSFSDNIYFAAPGQGWFHWGPTWARHKSYESLNQFEEGLGIDEGSRVQDPGFADLNWLDLRLRQEAMNRIRNCYPRGPVPGVLLGLVD